MNVSSETEHSNTQEKEHESAAFNSSYQSLVENWQNEQSNFKKRLQLYDTEPWQINRQVFEKNHENEITNGSSSHYLRYIAGLDISFVKGQQTACSGIFVFDLSDDMKIVYKDLDEELIEMDQPYVPGFLAYREAPFLLKKLEKLKKLHPNYYPQLIFIDGNGILHVNKFGMACHIGLLSNTPTVGVSKKLFQVFGLENDMTHKNKIKNELKKEGDYFELRSNEEDADLLGYCYRSTDKSTNPIYISIGNKISWQTCLWVVKLAIRNKYRIPEPIRQADLLTREHIRKVFKI